ncbi:MAG: DUF1667 domain-containing protein [Clostridiaceae bacterium]|nr:DUF1667 domain-containing protein [Clostridiaceae bacterium]
MTQIICITCPKGCHLQVDEENGYQVTGNSCPRGEAYGKNELKNPVRTLTSTVRLSGARTPRLPVKSSAPLPKGKIFDAMRLLDSMTVKAPVAVGQVLLADVFGTGVDIVATKAFAEE